MLYSLRQWLMRRLRAYPAIEQPLRQIYRYLRHKPQTLEGLIHGRLSGMAQVFFVQVGSNDGTHGDPISHFIRHEPRWRGIFVEPVPDIFKRLKAHYGNAPRFAYENVLVGDSSAPRKFYYVSEHAKQALGDAAPYWYDQLGSFDRQHIVKHLDGLLEPYIIEVELPCLPLMALLERNAVHQLDLLHIDTEGFDYEVLKQLDFSRFRPAVVLYEHKHLSAATRAEAETLLLAQGYQLRRRVDDTLALQPR
jgi:FkbM family methyltransferase